MPGGRPTLYSPELTATICAKLVAGQSLRSVCREESMPSIASVFKWLGEQQEFSEQYAKATEERAQGMFEDMLDIADDVEPDAPAIAKAKLRVDTRKWALSRMNPKKYGDKVEQTLQGADGGAVQVAWLKPE